MITCPKCGAELPDDAKSCSKCGAAIEDAQAEETAVAPAEEVKEEKKEEQAAGGKPFTDEDVENNKVMGVLAYIGILFLVPLIAAPNSKYAKFHTNQGLILFLCEVIWGVVQAIFSFVPVLPIILGCFNLVFLVLAIIGIIHAVNGTDEELPVIGKFRILK